MGGPNAEGEVVALGFGSDHTSWAYLQFEKASATDGSLTTEPTYFLARFPPMRAGRDQYPERMDVYGSELDPQSLLATCCGIAPRLDVVPDGSVWLPSDQGLAHFDGETWDWYLEGRPIEDIDIAPDGTVWVQANDLDMGPGVAYWEQEGTTSTYVVTPDAVTATE
jgi:hypothetical protein